jgi:hypothetical protein
VNKKTAGYSGTPLAKKLGIREGSSITVMYSPVPYKELFEEFPKGVRISIVPGSAKDLIHYFATSEERLVKDMYVLKNSIFPQGSIWISWLKKTSKIPTDINEDIIRKIAIANGLVDIKVCAVNENWSALKLVIPVKDRKNKGRLP